MSNNPPESYADDFLEQILAIPSYSEPVDTSSDTTSSSVLFPPPMFPPNLSLDSSSTAETVKTEGEPVLFPPFGLAQSHALPVHVPHAQQVFHVQPTPGMGAAAAALQPTANRPRVRARRGQATDPHSIAERVRRERIAERLKALQELVPSCNKTDRAAMLDEIVDYVKFLRLQVKVLSMSRLGGAGAVAQLVADTTLPPVEVKQGVIEGGSVQQPWDKWSDDGTEGEVAKLMEQDVGSAMQFLHSKALCIMPISLAATIFPANQVEPSTHVKSEPDIPL